MPARLLAVLSALLLLAAFPAGAQEEDPEPENQVCPTDGEVLTPEGFSGEVDTPSWIVGDESTLLLFRLDLDAPEGTRAALDASIDWMVPANDYDLDVNGSLSENWQPLDPIGEDVTVTVANCAAVYVSVVDFNAPVVVDTITLDIGVRILPPQ